MKVLMVNKFFYIKGGSETYYFALKRKLQKEGHTVVDFSMKDDRNFESAFCEYFVENVDYEYQSSFVSKIKMASNLIYSLEAKKKFETLILKEKPDIVHLHIFQHQLSPSILDVCKKYNIPTVYTAHDLKMVCLNYKMMHHGKICEACKNGHMYHCALNRCVKDSFVKSWVNVLEGYFHKWKKSYDAIDYVITPSEFYRKKIVEFGVLNQKVEHIPNFLDRMKPRINKREDSENYLLYFGRLSEEKGVITLARAMEGIDQVLYIVGTGPMEKYIKELISNNNLENIKLCGFKSGQELVDIIGNAKAVILPSEWYENGPYSAIEALQLGRPIIGANIGGIPELIQENGFLFESGNVDELNACLRKIISLSREKYVKMQDSSRKLFEETYLPNIHYKNLMKIYNKAIEKHKSC